MLAAGVGPPLARQVQAAGATGQHPVQQDDIGQGRIQFALGTHSVFGPQRRKAVVAQIHGNQLGNCWLVFDDQYLRQFLHACLPDLV